jgi:hypothetical protein
MPQPTNEIIDAAIEGFEAQKQRIDAQISDLRATRTAARLSLLLSPSLAAP